MLTIFHLDGERTFRGGERQLLYLARWLKGRGHRNVVACRRGSPLDREAARLELETLHLPFLGEWDPVSAALLRRAAGRAANPVLHAHTAHAAALAALAALLGGPPRVSHRRVDFPVRRGPSSRLKYGTAGRVIAVSEAIRALLLEAGVPSERVVVVPDGLPLTPEEARTAGLQEPPFSPAGGDEAESLRRCLAENYGLPEGGLWIGNLAAMVPHKDQATLLRAAAPVLEEFPEARFLVVGDGPLRPELEALAGSLGLQGAVVFPGRQADPAAWLRSLDLYVHPSWGEGMGSVLLEAMACRVPIVATTAGGIPEVLEHGRTALLAPPRSPQALADRILAALRDPAASRRRAEAAAARLTDFSLARLGEKTEAAYPRAPAAARPLAPA